MKTPQGIRFFVFKENMKERKTDAGPIRDILAKSLTLEVLGMDEVSRLIELKDIGLWEEVFETARLLKEKVYGNRIVLFAPLYLSNECVNNCVYCAPTCLCSRTTMTA